MDFGDWVDNEVFDAIRRFQKDNRLEVDGLMKPGGPTETAINRLIQRTAFASPRAVNLGAMERYAMCACTASDDNPYQDRPDPYE